MKKGRFHFSSYLLKQEFPGDDSVGLVLGQNIKDAVEQEHNGLRVAVYAMQIIEDQVNRVRDQLLKEQDVSYEKPLEGSKLFLI